MFVKRLLWLALAPALYAQWTPELSMKVKTVTAPVPSPDGHLAAWTETQAVMDGELNAFIESFLRGKKRSDADTDDE